MSDNQLTKVTILFNQGRFADAEQILKNLLATDANNNTYLQLLAEAYLQQDKFAEANMVVEQAITLSPDNPNPFYIKARLALAEDKYDYAETCINQAIALDPWDADYFAYSAHIQLIRKKYDIALNLANRALEIDAENILGLNTRSTALLKLNRKQESFETIEGALREDPNNAYTHANYGWGLLEKGNPKKALIHFKEALTTEPNNQYAQAGMLEALKAKNFLYRMFLKYSFWMNNLASRYQWAVIIGLYIAIRLLRAIADNNETFRPFVTPLIISLTIFAFSTWIITPISNLFLRFNTYGKYLLNKKEKLSSNLVAISFVIMVIGLVAYFVSHDTRYIAPAAYGLIMMAPLGVMFTDSKTKNLLLYYTIGLAISGALGIVMALSNGNPFNMFSILFVVGFFVFQWVANYQVIQDKA